MRVLFLSYFFPGPLGAMASWLAKNPEHQVIFASSRSRLEMAIPNVQRVVLRAYNAKARGSSDWFDLWDEAIRAGKSARATLDMVHNSGFEPDIIFCASSNGTSFGLRQLFPDALLINFIEESSLFHIDQMRMRRCMQYVQILEANLNFAFNENTRRQYPPALQPLIRLAPRVIDAAFFSPENAQPFSNWKLRNFSGRLVTVFGYGLNECELFHAWHALIELLSGYPELQLVFILPGSYAVKRLRMLKLNSAISDRLFLECHLRQDVLRDLLCASSLCVFPGKNAPFGILESMSCATAPMCVHAPFFLKNGWDMLEMQGRDASAMCADVRAALKDPALLEELGQRARQTAIANFAANLVMPRFFPEIEKAWQDWNA